MEDSLKLTSRLLHMLFVVDLWECRCQPWRLCWQRWPLQGAGSHSTCTTRKTCQWEVIGRIHWHGYAVFSSSYSLSCCHQYHTSLCIISQNFQNLTLETQQTWKPPVFWFKRRKTLQYLVWSMSNWLLWIQYLWISSPRKKEYFSNIMNIVYIARYDLNSWLQTLYNLGQYCSPNKNTNAPILTLDCASLIIVIWLFFFTEAQNHSSSTLQGLWSFIWFTSCTFSIPNGTKVASKESCWRYEWVFC